MVISLFISACGQAAEDGLPDMSFLNYTSVTDIHNGLLQAFPPGTSKEFVEKSLIEKGGAKFIGKFDGRYSFPDEKEVYTYRYQKPFYLRFLHDGKYTITIYYDESKKVKEDLFDKYGNKRNPINISGPTGL